MPSNKSKTIPASSTFNFYVFSHETLHSTNPPTFLSSASLTSSTPLSVLTNRHSPKFNPLTYPAGNPLAIRPRSEWLEVTSRLGRLTASSFRMTGSPFQYLSPSHSLRVATLAGVTAASASSAAAAWASAPMSSDSAAGGCGPPRATDERNPALWRASARRRLYLLFGRDVMPSRARLAFWRWEQALVMLWMPILAGGREAGKCAALQGNRDRDKGGWTRGSTSIVGEESSPVTRRRALSLFVCESGKLSVCYANSRVSQ